MSEPERESRVGSRIGRYHLKRLLGKGGMGEVYEAEHTVKEWTVAVKVMTDQFSKDPVFRERMKREARTAGRLHGTPRGAHPRIRRDRRADVLCEMRLIEGTDLDSMLKRFGPLTPPRAVAIITQIASALDAAHAAGVMHRDVKPPNILSPAMISPIWSTSASPAPPPTRSSPSWAPRWAPGNTWPPNGSPTPR